MKIIYSIGATHNSGGMERVLANKANYLAQKGHEVVIVTTDQQHKVPFFKLSSSIRQYDLNINYSANNGKGIWNKLLFFPWKQWKHRARLKKLLGEQKADIVVSMFDGDASFLWKTKDGSRKVLEIHFSRYKRLQYNRSGLWKWVDKYRTKQDEAIARKYDRFVVLTEEDRQYWGELPNIRVIPNANTFETKEAASLENPRAIAVGRLEEQKGFEDMIRAWQHVYSHYPEWKLSIFGQGSLRQKLLDLIESLSLKNVVSLENPVSDIKNKYLDSSILLMTSRYEGLPMSLLEAQCCGLPMVSYTCKCGPRDIIRDGKNGYLIPEGDIQLFAEKVNKIIENQALRKEMGKQSKELSANFQEDRIMGLWESLFKELTGNR
ncbi:MAG: glycosyltransferase family 4 protein [Dysgonamonadaceae bacterium]